MIYLDDSSTTQIDSRVLKAMMPYMTEFYANASSTHSFGQKSRFAIDEARYIIANYLHCTPQEIIFTSTGSESDTLAIKGTAEYLAFSKDKFEPQNVYIVTSPLEHSSVIKTISHMTVFGYKNRFVDVDQNGKVYIDEDINGKKNLINILDEIKSENENARIIITIQYVNSEIGTIQNIKKIAEIGHKYNALVHTDAMQAIKLLDISVDNLNIDMMTFASHKIYGPVGAAVLYLKSGSKISRQTDGGEQEYKIRAGTHNVASIVGFGKAVEILKDEKDERIKEIKKLSEIFINGLKNSIEGIIILNENNRIPSIISVEFPNINSSEFLVRLDIAGVMASAGTACNSGSIQPAANLANIGLNDNEINRVIRFSIGKNNTEEEINEAIKIISEEYHKYFRDRQNVSNFI